MPAILVVDDSAVDRRVLRELLGKTAQWQVQEAADGVQALAQIRQAPPDVVVTDLHMPEMDGLELVTALGADYPEVPVILITAYGSESLAIEALRQGAASYVPKSQLVDILCDTVQRVLELARVGRSRRRLIESLTTAGLTFALANDMGVIDAAVDLLQQMVAGMGFCGPSGRVRVGVALEQALSNALYHGNLELSFEQLQQAREELLQGKGLGLIEQRRAQSPYCQREIHLAVWMCSEEARFVIRDEGPGFDVAAVPAVDDPQAFEGQRGRGLVLMRSLMDEVTYNDLGNEVTLVKRRERAPDTAEV